MINSISVLRHLIFFLACIIPLALLSGPFLPDLFISIIGLIFLFLLFYEQKWMYIKNNFFYIFISFYIYLVLNSLISINPLFSLESSLFYFRFIIFSLAIWYIIDHEKNFLKFFKISIIITFSIAIFDGFYQYFNDVNIFGLKASGTRLTLLLSDELILGGFISRLMPLLIGLALIGEKFNKKIIYLVVIFLILSDILIFISGERTAFGILFLSTLFIIILISKYKLLRLLAFIASLLIIILISYLDSDIKKRFYDKTLNDIGINSSDDKINYLSIVHENYILTSFNMFKESPLIGHGPKLYRVLCNDIRFQTDKNSCSTHPHNIYAQLLSETGLIGFFFIMIINLYLMMRIFDHIYKYNKTKIRVLTDYEICLIACFISTLWPLLPSNNLFNNWINIVYFLPVGFYLSHINKNKSE